MMSCSLLSLQYTFKDGRQPASLHRLTQFNSSPLKKTLVFGASTKPHRYSYIAIRRLVDAGVETVAFGLREGTVKGVRIQTHLEGLGEVHTVTLYMRAERQKAYYKDILRLAPERVIFNPGAENPEFFEILEAEGIQAENACTLVMLSIGQY